MLEKIFKLKENNTTAKTEIIARLTTFMTMAYIIALNPNLLTGFGKDTMPELWNGVFLATCIASAIGTIVMAFLANKPFAMAPGMGLNSFFAVVVTNIVALTGMTYVASFQSALCIVLIEGIVFLVLSVLNIREKIVDAIPLGVRLGIAPAIGLMLLNIGVGSNAGVYSENGGPFYAMRDFFGALTPSLAKTNMGSGYSAMVLSVVTMFVGLFAIVVLAQRGVKGAVLLGILISSIIYWAGEAIFLGTNPFASLATASFVPAFGYDGLARLTSLSFQQRIYFYFSFLLISLQGTHEGIPGREVFVAIEFYGNRTVKTASRIPSAALLYIIKMYLNEITLTKLDERCDVDTEGIVAVSPLACLLAIDADNRLAHGTVEDEYGTLIALRSRPVHLIHTLAYPRQCTRTSRLLGLFFLAILLDGNHLQVPFLIKRSRDSPIVRNSYLLPRLAITGEVP